MQDIAQKLKSNLMLKDICCITYFVAMCLLTILFLLEMKTTYNWDLLPGLDIPLDEWYEALFHS